MADARDLIRLTATEAVGLLRRRELSPLELIDAAAARIEAVDGEINALPTRCIERAREQAKALMARSGPAPEGPGWLGGLPIAVKDYNDVAGVKTTHGSPIFAENVPEASDITVETLEANGTIPIAKSNVPEFAGANTFNEVFGATRNPWDLGRSVGGSSGGSAAALATGQVWLATGNDLGGSLRTPASFCAVVGLRPSPGRVPRGPTEMPFDPLWVEGPLGRTVADVALMLDAEVGEHPGDPFAMPPPAVPFSAALREAEGPTRVAFSPDLGFAAVEPEVATVCAGAVQRFADLGAAVEEACPDFSGAAEAFQTLRALLFSVTKAPLLEAHCDQIKPEIVWNIEKGVELSAEEIARAKAERGALYQRVSRFFERYDILACPTTQVAPFPVDVRQPMEIAGRELATYIDWIAITFAITLTACPAISVPCGFTEAGLPVGLQLVGRPHGEAALLAAAHRFEAASGISQDLPIEPRSASD